jgi:hypothetical protein
MKISQALTFTKINLTTVTVTKVHQARNLVTVTVTGRSPRGCFVTVNVN